MVDRVQALLDEKQVRSQSHMCECVTHSPPPLYTYIYVYKGGGEEMYKGGGKEEIIDNQQLT